MRAVPSWAEVLMIPAAVARSRAATLVPRVVAATEESPIPPPPTMTVKGTVHAPAAEEIGAASQIAMAPTVASVIVELVVSVFAMLRSRLGATVVRAALSVAAGALRRPDRR